MDRQIPSGQDTGAANTTIVWFRHEKHKRESDKDRNKNRERYRHLITGKTGTGGKRGARGSKRRQGTAGGKRRRNGNLIRPAEGDRVKRKNRNRTQHDTT